GTSHVLFVGEGRARPWLSGAAVSRGAGGCGAVVSRGGLLRLARSLAGRHAASSPYSTARVVFTVSATGTDRITPAMPKVTAPARKQKMISTGCTLAARPSTSGATSWSIDSRSTVA